MDDKYQLLFEDLCARIPYHPMVSYFDRDLYLVGLSKDGNQITAFVKESLTDGVEEAVDFVLIKPYLRKIPDITSEEVLRNPFIAVKLYYKQHFDCLGLIQRGVALEAPKDMYDFETENN